jgi:hypothetical protein
MNVEDGVIWGYDLDDDNGSLAFTDFAVETLVDCSRTSRR